MRIWIEVASGDQSWIRKKEKSSMTKSGLWAPNRSRYKNMLKLVNPGDIILTHLTGALTRKKEWKSAIVGLSIAESRYENADSKIVLPLTESVELKISIKFSQYKNNKLLSDKLQNAIRFCYQKYLIEITPKDFYILMSIHQENIDLLNKTPYSNYLKKVSKLHEAKSI